MIRRALVLAAATAGCVAQTDAGGDWEPVTTGHGALAPELGPAPLTADAPRCTVRIASWNVHFGADPEHLAAQLRGSMELARTDVLMVQEIEAFPDELRTRTARLAAALGMTWVYVPARPADAGTHGIAILSRHPLADVQVRQLPYFDQLVNPRNRIAMRAVVEVGDHRLQLVNLHLDVRLGPVDRIRQLHPAVNDIDDRVVVGGDFNTNPWAWFDGLVPLTGTEAVVGQQQAALVDDYLAGKALDGTIPVDEPTMRLPGVGMRIDNLYARDLAVLGAGVEHVDGSDHWPLWLDVDVCR